MEYCTLSYNLTVACHIYVQATVDYIGVTRTLGVVWVCRRFDYSHFCRRFDVDVLTCRRFEHRTSVHSNSLQTLFVIGLFVNVSNFLTMSVRHWICVWGVENILIL